MVSASPQDRRQALGDFLKAQRARVAPGTIGVPAGGRRRTPGLRREEVAQLCGLSVTWYTWIEQGRDVNASPGALARLARVLQLSPAERIYLFDLAGRRDPETPASAAPSTPPSLNAAVRAIGAPAYALDRYWNVVAWNTAAQRLFTGWLDRPAPAPSSHNLLRFVFLDPAAQTLIHRWAERAGRVLAEFRAESGAYPEDRALHSLIEELRQGSAVFARLWQAHAVLGREGGRREFNHPVQGRVACDQIAFALAGRTELKLVMLIPDRSSARPRRRRDPGA